MRCARRLAGVRAQGTLGSSRPDQLAARSAPAGLLTKSTVGNRLSVGMNSLAIVKVEPPLAQPPVNRTLAKTSPVAVSKSVGPANIAARVPRPTAGLGTRRVTAAAVASRVAKKTFTRLATDEPCGCVFKQYRDLSHFPVDLRRTQAARAWKRFANALAVTKGGRRECRLLGGSQPARSGAS